MARRPTGGSPAARGGLTVGGDDAAPAGPADASGVRALSAGTLSPSEAARRADTEDTVPAWMALRRGGDLACPAAAAAGVLSRGTPVGGGVPSDDALGGECEPGSTAAVMRGLCVVGRLDIGIPSWEPPSPPVTRGGAAGEGAGRVSRAAGLDAAKADGVRQTPAARCAASVAAARTCVGARSCDVLGGTTRSPTIGNGRR